MRGEITLRVLQAVGDGVVSFAECVEAVIVAGYGASYGKMNRTRKSIQEERNRGTVRRREQINAYNFVAYLRRDGLIQEASKQGRIILRVTPKGRLKVVELIQRLSKGLSLPVPQYRAPSGQATTIVVFDIPEKERAKRDWLRLALRDLGFRMIQRSVWLGSHKLPREFLRDLMALRMSDYVEIFQTTRTGTLRHLM